MSEMIHTTLGFCFWDIPALIILTAMVIVLIVHIVRQKKREKNMEEELASTMAEQVTNTKNSL